MFSLNLPRCSLFLVISTNTEEFGCVISVKPPKRSYAIRSHSPPSQSGCISPSLVTNCQILNQLTLDYAMNILAINIRLCYLFQMKIPLEPVSEMLLKSRYLLFATDPGWLGIILYWPILINCSWFLYCPSCIHQFIKKLLNI